MFTTPQDFEARVEAGGFLEWTEFLGNYYGTPVPEETFLGPDTETDLVLEIEVDGAQQVIHRHPEAILIFVLPPSRDEQERRLRNRGDSGDRVLARLRKAELEEPVGRALADHVVVNDDLEQTIDELAAIIESERSR